MESPHTRRKESLFHSDPTSPLTSPNTQRKSQGNHLNPSDCNMSNSNPYRYFSGGESDTCSSAESSPIQLPSVVSFRIPPQDVHPRNPSQSVRAKRSFAGTALSPRTSAALWRPARTFRGASRCPPSPAFRGRKHGGNMDRFMQHTVNLHKGGTLRSAQTTTSTLPGFTSACWRPRTSTISSMMWRASNCCVALYLNPESSRNSGSTIIRTAATLSSTRTSTLTPFRLRRWKTLPSRWR